MKTFYLILSGLLPFLNIFSQPTLRLSEKMLMHEMRATPYPADKAVVAERAVSFQWPLSADTNIPQSVLDGMEDHSQKKTDKTTLRYQIRYSQDPSFKKAVVQAETRWPFFNPETALSAGKWYWQYGYVVDGKTLWQSVQELSVADNPNKFCPPSLKTVLSKIPASHPRVWMMKEEWQDFRTRNQDSDERRWYIEYAEKVLKTPMKSVTDINTSKIGSLDNEVKRKALLTRESRRIIDKEEQNTEALIRSYLLTQDKRYADEAIRRVLIMADWNKSKNVAGDFNAATLLSLCSMAYDSFYDLLTEDQRNTLLGAIREKGSEMYAHYNNHLENHIADNHVWQMTLRILTMAAFTAYDELPEAAIWVDYCYNVWLARFPGLNTDGAWHNGDSYFTVNTRTLIEVPYYFSKLTGFDFFSDPWYQGNIMYTMFQQPPFSKSGGNGSSHQNILKPSSVRIGYLDALARLTGNTYAADFVRTSLKNQPDYLKTAYTAKSGNLAWFRLQCEKPLPEGAGLSSLPSGYVFPESGLASFMTNWSRVGSNAMLSFRSSPYGSTSHALANQNAFNTFFGGSSLFYSSGHHVSFTDQHSIYCHRATRAHNTILADGMGQRIGTEGYGWIPRHYVGQQIGYVLGDASNAYGDVVSPLWKERFQQSGLEATPKTGWDKNHVKKFRRHVVTLGNSGLAFIYDELEADKPIAWSYLLHAVNEPIEVDNSNPAFVYARTANKGGVSDAYLFSDGKLTTETTDQFFHPAVNWLRADDNGHFKPYPNHYHFSATSAKKTAYRFATIIHTHAKKYPSKAPEILKDGRIKMGSWIIKVNVSADDDALFFIRSTKKGEDVTITYKRDGATIVRENGKETVLTDSLPTLEI